MLVAGSGLWIDRLKCVNLWGKGTRSRWCKEGLHFKCFALECVFKMYLSCGLQRDVLGLVGIAQIEGSDLFAFWPCSAGW